MIDMLKITHKIVGLTALLGLIGCDALQKKAAASNPFSYAYEETKTFRTQKMNYHFSHYSQFCPLLTQWDKWNLLFQRDWSLVNEFLHKKVNFSKREANLISQGMVGTGMTFAALDCRGNVKSVNKAFYQGVGHSWQAVMYGGSYVYLEGDGTEIGMKVTGWN